MSILQKIKSGKKNYKLIEFPGTEEMVAIVILSSQELTDCKLKADEYIESRNIKDEDYKDIILQQYIMYNALRDKDDLNTKLASNIEEFRQLIDNNELAFLQVQYNMFMQDNSPFLSAINEEQFEELKKTLNKTTLKDLNGVSLLALRNFLISLK